MQKFLTPFVLTLIATAMSIALLPAHAAAQDDPPNRVGRLNFIQGSISYQVSGDQDWVQADPNRPLTTGDNLWADKDSRGEVHIGSTAIRLFSETGLSFLNLDDRTVQLQLPQGTIEVHLRNLASGDAFEVDTPNLALTLTRAGEYRIETDPNGGSTVVVVREGHAEATGGNDSWNLGPGQQYTFNGTDQLTYDAAAAPGFDDFENWCQSRDQQENRALSAQYVSRDVDGYYDLDEYGDWQADADYGEVWIPRSVAVGWAPYQIGHWVFIAPWGWTWVDAEPWGFAPFHYGRWLFVGSRWGWVPGPLVVRPVYAPALVGFVGGGFGVSVSFGVGPAGLAWFPLGPRDVFVPGYSCSPRYFQNVNITNTRAINVTQVRNFYSTAIVNRNVSHLNYTYASNATAVTAVSRETFVNAHAVNREEIHVTPDQIQSARVVESAPLAPTRASYVSATAHVSNAKPTVPFSDRSVVTRMNPAPPRAALTYTNDTHPFNEHPANQEAQGGNNNGASAAPGNNGGQPSRDGFRSFQPPANSNASQATNRTNNSNSQTRQPQENAPRPTVRFAPPQNAREENYDVHPPLNQRPPQAQAPPRQEAPHTQPAPHPQEATPSRSQK